MERNPDSPWNPQTPVEISPTDFEKQVTEWLQKVGRKQGYSFKATHQGVVAGHGGCYAIDVLLEFTLLGGAFVQVLVECKHQKRPVERDEVIVLEGKLRDVGGHKGMLFSTSGFQSGAIEYAAAHGIATVTVVAGEWLYETRAAGPTAAPPPWAHFDRFAGIRLSPTEKGVSSHNIDKDHLDALSEWVAGEDS